MEVLGVLEQKIAHLVELGKTLKEENAALLCDVEQLKNKLEAAEHALLKDKDKLNQEAEVTRMVMEDLIRSIDSLVEDRL